jgi:hypothetical protein
VSVGGQDANKFHATYSGVWTCGTPQLALEMSVLSAFSRAGAHPPEYEQIMNSGRCLPLDSKVEFTVVQKYRFGDMSESNMVALGEIKFQNGSTRQFYVANQDIAQSHPEDGQWHADNRYMPTNPGYSMPSVPH